MTQVQTYRERSHIFLDEARRELADGDLEQGSEKAWGAAAMILKSVAEQRGLEHATHRQLFPVLRVVVGETGDTGLRDLFDTANLLHHNFYEHWLTAEELTQALERVEQFVERVEQLALS